MFSHFDKVNNGLIIIWLSGKFYLQDTVGSPIRARYMYRHLACLGSQSQHRIQFIFPTHRASHACIIKEIKLNKTIFKDVSYSSYLLSPCPNLPPSPDPHEYTSPSRLRAKQCLHSGFVAILTISHFPASDSINTGP